MNRNKSFVFSFCLALLFATAMPSVLMADEWDKATKLTFSEPVEVPVWFSPRAPIGSHSRTEIPIATSFKSGTPIERT